MRKIILAAIAACTLSTYAAAKTPANDTLVVSTTPVMHCQGCETKIKKNIRFVKGTKRIDTNLSKQTVTIVYDGTKAKYEDYVAAFKKIGFGIKRAK